MVEKKLNTHYEEFYKSVTVGKEHDVRGRFIQHVIIDGLGYPEDCYLNEKEWADIWLLESKPLAKPSRHDKDESRFRILPVVIIETKEMDLPDNKLPSKENLLQVVGYALKTRTTTQYIALTNFKRFIVWRFEPPYNVDQMPKPLVDVNLEAEMHHSVFSSGLQGLACISYEEILKSYDNFLSSANIDLANDDNFELFTSVVKWKILDENLIPVFKSLALSLLAEYESFTVKQSSLQYLKKSTDKRLTTVDIDRQMRHLEVLIAQ